MADDTPTGDPWSRDVAAQLASIAAVEEFVNVFEGMVRGLKHNGWTDDQARAIVAWQFGWRRSDGTTPEGAERGGFTPDA